jgi:hypothetical protein
MTGLVVVAACVVFTVVAPLLMLLFRAPSAPGPEVIHFSLFLMSIAFIRSILIERRKVGRYLYKVNIDEAVKC